MPIEIKLTLSETRDSRLAIGIAANGDGSSKLIRAANLLYERLRKQLELPAGEKRIGRMTETQPNRELPPPHDGLG